MGTPAGAQPECGAVTSACVTARPGRGTSTDGRLSVRPGNLAADRCPAEETDADGHRAADSWRSNWPCSPASRTTNSAPAPLPATWNRHAARRHFPPLGGRAPGLRRSSPIPGRTPSTAGGGQRATMTRMSAGTVGQLRVAVTDPQVIGRYRAHIKKGHPGQCWLWTGAISGHGHGRFHIASNHIRRPDGQPPAHRPRRPHRHPRRPRSCPRRPRRRRRAGSGARRVAARAPRPTRAVHPAGRDLMAGPGCPIRVDLGMRSLTTRHPVWMVEQCAAWTPLTWGRSRRV